VELILVEPLSDAGDREWRDYEGMVEGWGRRLEG